MTQQVTKYKILLASPSDLQDEREAVDSVIAELNITYCGYRNIAIELLKWETHSAPAVGNSSTQDIIDEDFGSDYDIFIGLFWKKFGTPTLKFQSGTEQEFENALKRYRDGERMQILFYFKIATPGSLADINTYELQKVNSFKQRLIEEQILFWEYNTIEELQSFLRIHIQKRLEGLINETISTVNPLVVDGTDGYLEDELGILDYEDRIEESFQHATDSVSRIAEATIWIGEEITKKGIEYTLLTSENRNLSKKVLRDFFKRTADLLTSYATRIEVDVPFYLTNFEKGIEAVSKSTTIYNADFQGRQNHKILEAISALGSLSNDIESGLNGMQSFLDSVSALPRIEKELNRSRRNVETILSSFVGSLNTSIVITNELLKSLTEMYNSKTGT